MARLHELLTADGLPRAIQNHRTTAGIVREYRSLLQDAFEEVYFLTRGAYGLDVAFIRDYPQHLHNLALRYMGDYWTYLSHEVWGTELVPDKELEVRPRPNLVRMPKEVEEDQGKVMEHTRKAQKHFMKAAEMAVDMQNTAEEYEESMDPVCYPEVLEFMKKLWKSGAIDMWGRGVDTQVRVHTIPTMGQIPEGEGAFRLIHAREETDSEEDESPAGKKRRLDGALV